jgi:hypothetical protein
MLKTEHPAESLGPISDCDFETTPQLSLTQTDLGSQRRRLRVGLGPKQTDRSHDRPVDDRVDVCEVVGERIRQ